MADTAREEGSPPADVPIRRVTPERLPAIAALLGRAFVAEPMMRWPLGGGDDLAGRLARAFEAFDAPLVAQGLVWEAGEALGAAGWIPPGQSLAEYDAEAHDAVVALADDGGRRWDAFWEWVEARSPSEPVWFLDHVGVDPSHQGAGVGRALIEHGLARARADGLPAFLETGNPRNVAYYERFGFEVVEEATPPGGAPTVWFMRSPA